MKTSHSFTATIYVGLKEGYDGPIHTIEEVKAICQRYVDNVGLAVTVTPTWFVYTKGEEPGAIVGLINYPRFPSSSSMIIYHAVNLVQMFIQELHQERITFITPETTYMHEKSDFEEHSDENVQIG